MHYAQLPLFTMVNVGNLKSWSEHRGCEMSRLFFYSFSCFGFIYRSVKLWFFNVIILQDPCRAGVKEAVKVCTDAGVKVVYYVLFLSHRSRFLLRATHVHLLGWATFFTLLNPKFQMMKEMVKTSSSGLRFMLTWSCCLTLKSLITLLVTFNSLVHDLEKTIFCFLVLNVFILFWDLELGLSLIMQQLYTCTWYMCSVCNTIANL